jgi:hypothetical protein
VASLENCIGVFYLKKSDGLEGEGREEEVVNWERSTHILH